MPMGMGDNKGNKGGSTTETTTVDIELTFVVEGDGETPEWEENVRISAKAATDCGTASDTGVAAQGPGRGGR